MHEATFRLRHDCPYRDLSERFPDVTVREWYHADCQVLEITAAGGSDADALVGAVEEIGDVLGRTADDDGVRVVARSCECPPDEDTVVDVFRRHDCVHVPPTVYRRGWERYTVIGFDGSDVSDLLAELNGSHEIEVVSKKQVEERRTSRTRGTLFPVDRLFADMTDRQIGALRVALDNGYYDEPRGASVEEMARETTVARATFEEHLRKAENKLMSNVGGFVRLLSETEADAGLRRAEGVRSRDGAARKADD